MNTLMHICCAPCANRPIDLLRSEGLSVAGFWFNPNIPPYTTASFHKPASWMMLPTVVALPWPA